MNLKKVVTHSLRTILPKPFFKKLKSAVIPNGYIYFSDGWLDEVKFNEDGMATAHNADFLKDKKFIAAYEAGYATESWGPIGRTHIRWRVFNACTLSKYCMRVPGDFVECGTNRGGTAAAIIHYNDFKGTEKKFFLLDTFAGYDTSTLNEKEIESIKDYQQRYSECYEDVKKTFKEYEFVKIIKGAVPSTLPQVHADKIAFLHIDMNCAAPERAALEYFWDKITPGGVVLLDDYAWVHHEDQKKTMDDFASSKGIDIVGMATGQGLILKPYW